MRIPSYLYLHNRRELRQAIKRAGNKDGLEFIQVMVNAQSRSDLGRPTIPALKNKENFMNYIVRR